MADYILSIEDFKRKADISANLNTDKLKAQIGPTQDQFAYKILCNELLAEILSQLPNDLSVANTALMPYLKNYLVYKTYARYLVGSNVMATAAGMRVQIDSTSEAADEKQMAAIRKQAENDANFYQDTLVNFLIKNEDDYPLWKDSICNCNRNSITQRQNMFSKVGTSVQKTPIKWS
jgi:hypothetical protein